jgi:hypothetical protein
MRTFQGLAIFKFFLFPRDYLNVFISYRRQISYVNIRPVFVALGTDYLADFFHGIIVPKDVMDVKGAVAAL